MNTIKTWPHLTIVAVIFAILGGVAAALWVRHEPPAGAEGLPAAVRLERVEGEVALNRSLDGNFSDTDWIEATPNLPLTTGDRLYTRDSSRAGIGFTGRNFARLEENSALDVLSLTDRRTQVALRDGSALFDLGHLDQGEIFEVATPYGAVDFVQPGLYQVGLDDGSAMISVLSGLAQVVGLAGAGQISKGEVLALVGQAAADIVLSRIDPSYAGGLVDDYYGYRYPQSYDGRYLDYNVYQADPYYYDPYNQYESYRYASDRIPGIYDLDYYGDWQNVDGYGHSWTPHVESGWAPYQQGYWTMDYPYGMTWVSSEPWGFAPYHYGRWANVNDRWFWVPEAVGARPSYAPALVAFVPPNETNDIGWIPLAPGDPYVDRYYDRDWEPQYFGRREEMRQQLINLRVPGALTMVPLDALNRRIDRRSLRRGRERWSGVQPVLDPLSVESLRHTVLETRGHRRRIELPRVAAERLANTPVFSSRRPVAPPFRRGLPQALRTEVVPRNSRNTRLKVRDERQATPVRRGWSTRWINNAREDRNERRQIGRGASEARRRQRAEVEVRREAARQRANGAIGQRHMAQQRALERRNRQERVNQRVPSRPRLEVLRQRMPAQRREVINERRRPPRPEPQNRVRVQQKRAVPAKNRRAGPPQRAVRQSERVRAQQTERRPAIQRRERAQRAERARPQRSARPQSARSQRGRP